MFRQRNSFLPILFLVGMTATGAVAVAANDTDGSVLYQSSCAECHGADRFG